MKNIKEVLAGSVIDNAVGIKVTHMEGDEKVSLYVAEVAAGKSINAHYHRNGVEIYYIEEGSGTMKLGDLKGGEQVEWTDILDVIKGDCLTIKPGQVHSLINKGAGSMIVIVGCAMANLSTDRYVCKAA
jgi:mannose-6-phosphate isomerase-like protein (cupin superfamily)